MGISIFRKKSLVYGLTPRGKKRAEEVNSQTPEGEILCMLEEHGESSMREIANETHLDFGTVKSKVNKMARVGLLRGETGETE